MEEMYLLNHPGVKKRILSGGQGRFPHFPKGTKLVFHFQTLLDNFERTVIDDSRKNKQPTEIFVGKMFKMEVWEVLLTSMRIGEVAEFWCDAIHTGLYPIVSKGIRLAAQGKDPLEGQKHMCGMGNVFTYHSTGFPELDELMKEPQPLIFIMELISVGDPLSYHRESWLMDKDDKMQMVPSLHLQGNNLVQKGCYREASEKYKEAVLLLRVVQSREMPGDEDYINLGKLIIPLDLNYCQCMLELEEYYEVIEHATELIEKHKDCVKAYYKRAKAYAAVWSEKEAKRDFLMVSNLDVTLSGLVQKELKLLSERMKEKYWVDKERYWNMLEEKGKNKEKEEDKVGLAEQNTLSEPTQCTQQEAKEQKEEKSERTADQNVQASQVEDPKSEASKQMATLTEGKDRQQMLRLIMLLQDEAGFHIKNQRYAEAMAKFKEALELVDYIQTKEVDYKGEDWESLEKVRVPLTLNLSQCKLELGEYQEVVDLNNQLLKNHRDNLKAVYQRARAHSALYNEAEARQDFSRAVRLDPKFKPIVQQELKKLGENLRVKHANDKKNYWASSQEKWEKKFQKKKGSKTEKKKEVKWADESKTTPERSAAVKDEGQYAKITSSDEGQESIFNLPGKEGQDEKTTSDRENANCPGIKYGEEESSKKSVDKGRDLAQAKARRDSLDSTTKLTRDREAREASFKTSQEETVKNTAGPEKTSHLKSADDQEESINRASAGELSSSVGPENEERLSQQSNGPGCAESKKLKNAHEKACPKKATTTASVTYKAASVKQNSTKIAKRKSKNV